MKVIILIKVNMLLFYNIQILMYPIIVQQGMKVYIIIEKKVSVL